MATYDWPTGLIPGAVSLELMKAGVQFRSPMNGTPQSIDYVAERWRMSVTLVPMLTLGGDGSAGLAEAFFARLSGGVHRVRAWHFARSVPRGTLRGSPTVKTTATRGATSLVLQNASNNATLKAGDMIGCVGHLFQAAEDCTAGDNGEITVPLVNRVRSTIAAGASVTWNKPTADFCLYGNSTTAHHPMVMDGLALDLEEVY